MMRHNDLSPTNLENGNTIPIIAPDKYEDTNLGCSPCSETTCTVPCTRVAVYYRDNLLELLDKAGNMRFDEKVSGFQTELKYMKAGQCLYHGIMKALGYARNQVPFLELAGRIPLPAIASILDGNETYEECLMHLLQAKFLGTAWLLPSQRQTFSQQVTDTPWVNELENIWQISGSHNTMPFTDWKLFRTRPANSPLRRLAGMSQLVLRYREKGILSELVELARETPMEKAHYNLEEGLMVSGDDYWANQFDFGNTWQLSPWLIGQSRAADIVVNVLLPFVSAWSCQTHQEELGQKAFALYHTYPVIQENAIERHLRTQFGLKTTEVNSARWQQGLLHCYKRWCTQGRGEECLLSQANFKSGMTSRDKSLVLPA